MKIITNNIPNTLTIMRILMIPLMVLFFYMEAKYGSTVIFLCFFTYVFAAITDYFDGFFARKLNQHSAFGTFLDPISDKILVSVLLITLVAFDRITGLWTILVMLIFTREFLVSGMREYLGPKKISMPVTQIAKLKTTVQMVAIGFLILSNHSPYAYEIGLILLTLATILTIISGLQYFFKGVKHIKDEQTEN
ncbi:MAG: CDP-diacylglycerol--glycerol-3-phosphate 3-phosphatidyltransferase [Alcanivorax sp.]